MKMRYAPRKKQVLRCAQDDNYKSSAVDEEYRPSAVQAGRSPRSQGRLPQAARLLRIAV